MVSSHSHTHTQKKDYIVIETSNGLRCVRSHWQYYSRSTAPARQRKIKANRRQKKKKNRSANGVVQLLQDRSKIQLLFFSHADCCKLPKEASVNETALVRRNKQLRRRWPCYSTLRRSNPMRARACNMPDEDEKKKKLPPFEGTPPPQNCASEKLVYNRRLRDIFHSPSCRRKCARDCVNEVPLCAMWSVIY